MMKTRVLILGLALVMMLGITGCGHEHQWKKATCEEPKTCEICGETKGKKLKHSWVEATYEETKYCEKCGKTKGEPLKEEMNSKEEHVEDIHMSEDAFSDFTSWSFPLEYIVGDERSFYVDGHKVNMPNYIGEWEELLGIKFVDIPRGAFGGSTNYEYNNVFLADEDGVQYLLMINTRLHEKNSDINEELEQLRNTQTIGWKIMTYEDGGINEKMAERISLLPDKNIFEGDPVKITEEIAAYYGAEVEVDDEQYYVRVDNFGKGYQLVWHYNGVRNERDVEVTYSPDPYLAYYDFMANDHYLQYFEELAGYEEEEIAFTLMDISNDGIDELILHGTYTTVALVYDWDNGTLNHIILGDETVGIMNIGVYVDSFSLYESDGYVEYSNEYDYFADYISTTYSVLGLGELVKEDTCIHNQEFINGKPATDEVIQACDKQYQGVVMEKRLYTLTEGLEEIASDSELIYVSIDRKKEEMISKFDDSALVESPACTCIDLIRQYEYCY